MEGVELEFRDDALRRGREAGARSARPARAACARSSSTSLLDTMYDLPSLENVSKVVVDEAMISGDGKPLLIYSDQPQGRERARQ